ncbi:AAA family ATPase [Viscerimonas tarda]
MDSTLFSFQKKYIEMIESGFQSSTSVLVSGKSGVGKTYICDSFIKSKTDFNLLHCTFSDSSISTTDHRELKLAIFDYLSSKKKSKIDDNTVKKLSKASKDIPHVGNVIDTVLDVILNWGMNHFNSDTMNLFIEEECDIINQLSKLSKDKPLIIFFDNAHWMSTHTFNFLNNLIHTFHKISKNNVYYLFATTSNQENNPDIIFQNNCKRIEIEDISKKDYIEIILKFISTKQFENNEIINMLFVITKGHIELTKNLLSIIEKYQEDNKLEFIEKYQESLKTKEEIIDIFLKLFNMTLAQYFKENQYAAETIETLEIASIIGNVFNKYDLSELLKTDYHTLSEYISNACLRQFTIDEEKTARFIHPLIRDLFFKRLDSQQRIWHDKYAECLKILRPTETMLIGFHYQCALNHKNAIKYYLVGYIKCLMNGIEIPTKIHTYILKTISDIHWSVFFSSIKKATELYKQHKLAESIKVFEELDTIDIPTEFLSHYRNLLYSEILIQHEFRTEQFQKAAIILEAALNYFTENAEIELSINTLLILMNLYADKLNNSQQAKLMEHKFLALYQKYNQNDNLEQYYYEYKRKSSPLYSPEIALKRTNECLNFYSSNYYTIEYYKCLCNYSGLLIFTGNYSEAINTLNSCTELMKNSISISFPEPHKFINNYILANYLYTLTDQSNFSTNTINAITAFENYIEKTNNNYGTKILNINRASLYCLSGDIETAKHILYEIAQQLENNEDAFYHIYVYSNLASISYIEKNYYQSKKHLDIVEKHTSRLMPNMKPFFEERTRLFQILIKEKVNLDTQDLLIYFLKQYPNKLGKSWNFVGLGFLFSDMQFYTT